MKLRRLIAFVWVFIPLAFTPSAFAETDAQKPAADKSDSSKNTLSSQDELVLKSFSERYEELKNWKADFSHETYSVVLGNTRISKGELAFAYPNKFRFSLNGPSEYSDFVSNGKEAWYVRYPQGRSKPAQVQHFKDVTRLELDKYLILLRGISAEDSKAKTQLLRDFQIESSVDEKQINLSLTPRRASDVSKVAISFLQNQKTPHAAQIVDSLGGESTIKLAEGKKVSAHPKKTFVVTYPEGSQVEVIQ